MIDELHKMNQGMYFLFVERKIEFLWWKRNKLVPYGVLYIIRINAKCRKIQLTLKDKQKTTYQVYMNNDGLILSRYIKMSSKILAVTNGIDLFDKQLFETIEKCIISPINLDNLRT